MIPKLDILRRITEAGLVAVVRAESGDEARRVADAVLAGGCPAIEMTFTVPGAHRVIEEMAKAYKPSELILGAGTVLDPETARIAILSGASYVVSPSLNPETVRLCNRYQVPVMPGAMTIRDVIEAIGPSIIRAIKGPLPQAPLMPTGGVDLSNVAEWIEAGAVAVGAGGSLTGGARTGDFASITSTARAFIERIREARGK